jgi:nitroimidazol reductase NimA-like FMN-containing flavoprotein (pyridoxamine 5'-phosphate oxidase superfamily)
MNRNDFINAENYWIIHDKHSIKMERSAILKAAEKFLTEHNTCALATGCDDFVRCTPIEYSWMNGSFYLLSEGGLKFRALARNKNVCLAVFETYKGMDNIASIQVSGKAEMISYGSEEYSRVLEIKKIPESAIQRLSHPMYLIKIVPKSMELLFSGFKENGFDSRQQVTMNLCQ